MSQRDPRMALRHMIDYAQASQRIAGKHTQADLEHDEQFRFALIHAVEILGEAANRVPHTIRESHPEIPWSSIISARNRLIHGYDAVDLNILWRIVRDDIPPLIIRLTDILEDMV